MVTVVIFTPRQIPICRYKYYINKQVESQFHWSDFVQEVEVGGWHLLRPEDLTVMVLKDAACQDRKASRYGTPLYFFFKVSKV